MTRMLVTTGYPIPNQRVIQPGYTGQIAVDDKKQVTVATDMSQNVTDYAEFKPLVEQVEGNLAAPPKEGTANAGYSSYSNQ